MGARNNPNVLNGKNALMMIGLWYLQALFRCLTESLTFTFLLE